jgi:hypothetical protein
MCSRNLANISAGKVASSEAEIEVRCRRAVLVKTDRDNWRIFGDCGLDDQ